MLMLIANKNDIKRIQIKYNHHIGILEYFENFILISRLYIYLYIFIYYKQNVYI